MSTRDFLLLSLGVIVGVLGMYATGHWGQGAILALFWSVLSFGRRSINRPPRRTGGPR
jgi:membrane protein DedA with SNARE-associated domain